MCTTIREVIIYRRVFWYRFDCLAEFGYIVFFFHPSNFSISGNTPQNEQGDYFRTSGVDMNE